MDATARPAVVIDNGTGYTKMGFAGNVEPCFIVPTVVAVNESFVGQGRGQSKGSWAAQHSAGVMADLDFYIGEEAVSRSQASSTYTLSYPIRQGQVQNWDTMERFWQQCIFNYLRCDPEDHYFLLTESPLTAPENREYTGEIMFETFNVPGLYIAVQAVLALAAGYTASQCEMTGVVLDAGDGVTHVVPVADGYVMGSYIKSIPIAGRDLTLFVQQLMRASIHSVFCCASGSLINCHKSSGFVVGVDDVCTWGQHQGFTWVGLGKICRYLGFHVGLEVSLRQQFEPVLASIWRKLCHWASMHLSLAGKALVVNQVLLATAWFTTSCWTLYPQTLSRLRHLVCNFLWGGSDGTRDTRARVAWHTVILPKEEGGLGIIDPEMQSAALLSKLIVRGLYLGEDPWKQFMLHGLSRCVPSSGCMDGAGPWGPSIRYIFTMQSRLCTRHLSPFMYSIFRVWLTMRRGLIRHTPLCQEEIERQPLIWNDCVRDEHGRQLGERTDIDWARWAFGPASSFAVWAKSSYGHLVLLLLLQYGQSLLMWDTEIMAMDLGMRRGIVVRMGELDAAIPDDWQQVLTGHRDMPLHVGWWASFDPCICVKERGENIPSEDSFDIARRVKEAYCYTCADIVKEFGKHDKEPAKYIKEWSGLHTKTGSPYVCEVGYERFLAPEVFFSPEIYNSDFTTSLPEVVDHCIQSAPIDTRRALYKNIVLSGGSTMFKDFQRRLQRDLKKIVDARVQATISKHGLETHVQAVDVNVVSHPIQRFAVWFGGSVLASTPEFYTACHTKAEYDEYGPSICRTNPVFKGMF
ncbi:hypothetical protein L7F22_004531 [Adiantum nelumboides]|nr:hypothetical protein [Adiantum nelumboides]